MDIKYLLCEPVSKLAIKATPAVFVQPSNHDMTSFHDPLHSPKSICSSLSSSSASSFNSTDDHGPLTPYWDCAPYRRRRCRTMSEIGHVREHVFVYNSRRVRSESTGSTRTPWTPFEDELLRRGYSQGLSWAMISSTYLPHRSRGCCWGRFKTLQNKNLVDPSQSCYFKKPWKSVEFDHN
jgi:hypothetical protein